jgi:hypothetical protein
MLRMLLVFQGKAYFHTISLSPSVGARSPGAVLGVGMISLS